MVAFHRLTNAIKEPASSHPSDGGGEEGVNTAPAEAGVAESAKALLPGQSVFETKFPDACFVRAQPRNSTVNYHEQGTDRKLPAAGAMGTEPFVPDPDAHSAGGSVNSHVAGKVCCLLKE